MILSHSRYYHQLRIIKMINVFCVFVRRGNALTFLLHVCGVNSSSCGH